MNKQITRSNGSVLLRFMKATFMAGFLPALVLIFCLQTARAGSATWKPHPTSGDWNTAANWRPRTIPNGPSDTATFAVSDRTGVTLAGSQTEANGIRFAPSASLFTITMDAQSNSTVLTLSGFGFANDSGVTQNILVSNFGYGGELTFANGSTVGGQISFTVEGSGNDIAFRDTASAGSGTFTIEGTSYFQDGHPYLYFFDDSSAADGNFTNTGGSGPDSEGGETVFSGNSTAANGTFTSTAAIVPAYTAASVRFTENSTAGNASITNEGSQGIYLVGGHTTFYDTSTAANAIITCHGGDVAGAEGSLLEFHGTSFAGDATLIANGGSDGGEGGLIQFSDTADGGTARVELFGNGTLDISGVTAANISIGSLEGDGIVSLGSNTLVLTVGTNDLSTSFSGLIQGGSLVTKSGSGTLTLTGANSYTGGTTIVGGFLKITNRNGSATGSGAVTIYPNGTLGGAGIVGGNLIVASGGTLAPGTGTTTLTVKRRLDFNAASYYAWRVKTTSAKADRVIAGGVHILFGAFFSGIAIGNAVLSPGTTFIAITNTSLDPIFGTLSNLPDGGTFKLGNNTFQANYEGGDGNDLTLTVVP